VIGAGKDAAAGLLTCCFRFIAARDRWIRSAVSSSRSPCCNRRELHLYRAFQRCVMQQSNTDGRAHPLRQARSTDLPDGQITSCARKPVQPPRKKYFAFSETQISCSVRTVPARSRGAYRDRHGRWAWDAVDAAATRDGEGVWSWRPDAGAKVRGVILAERRWQKSPVTGEITYKP